MSLPVPRASFLVLANHGDMARVIEFTPGGAVPTAWARKRRAYRCRRCGELGHGTNSCAAARR